LIQKVSRLERKQGLKRARYCCFSRLVRGQENNLPPHRRTVSLVKDLGGEKIRRRRDL